MVSQAFFLDVRKKTQGEKKLKIQGKNSKFKPKAQKVGTFLKLSDVFYEKLQVLWEKHEKNMSKLKEKTQT